MLLQRTKGEQLDVITKSPMLQDLGIAKAVGEIMPRRCQSPIRSGRARFGSPPLQDTVNESLFSQSDAFAPLLDLIYDEEFNWLGAIVCSLVPLSERFDHEITLVERTVLSRLEIGNAKRS